MEMKTIQFPRRENSSVFPLYIRIQSVKPLINEKKREAPLCKLFQRFCSVITVRWILSFKTFEILCSIPIIT